MSEEGANAAADEPTAENERRTSASDELIRKIGELAEEIDGHHEKIEELDSELVETAHSARQLPEGERPSLNAIANATRTKRNPKGLSRGAIESRLYKAYPDQAPPSVRAILEEQERGKRARRRTRSDGHPGVGISKAAKVVGLSPMGLRGQLEAGRGGWAEGRDFIRIEDPSVRGGVVTKIIRPDIVEAVQEMEEGD